MLTSAIIKTLLTSQPPCSPKREGYVPEASLPELILSVRRWSVHLAAVDVNLLDHPYSLANQHPREVTPEQAGAVHDSQRARLDIE